ncbi:MAG TPA: hypothetical protein VF596_04995 [Pyrinomonadaceae bacterium]|jgi:cell division protein FtsB
MNNLLKHGATGSSALEQFLLAASLLLIFCFTANGQTVSVAQNKTDPQTNTSEKRPNDETENRVKQLETEVQTMRAELDALKKLLLQQQAAQNLVKAELQTSETVAVKTEDKTTEAVKTETKETIKTEPKQQTPPKQLGVDLGSVRLTPYGTIYFNAFNNTGSTNNQDVPLFAIPFGQSGASASVRQTRLGLRFEGARIGNARLGGVIEADFFGGFPAAGTGENFGVARLRLANAKLDWEKTSVTIGQDWMPFAPVNPTSIAAAAIPQLAAAGNPWARLPQVRVDHQITDKIILTGAILTPQTGDYPPSIFFSQSNSGEASRLPFFQSRIAFAETNWLGTKKNGAIGVSGHYGRSRSGNTFFVIAEPNVSYEVDSFGLAVDWNFPLHARISFAGEAFFGRNLGGFQAGVFQGLNTGFAYRENDLNALAGIRSIGTRGGWTQIGFTPDAFKDRLTVYGSIGIDDPRNEDLVSFFPSYFRSRNLAYAFNAIYKITPQFQIGAEFRRFETQYFSTGKRTNNHVNLGATYSF